MDTCRDLLKEYIGTKHAYRNRKWQAVCKWEIAEEFEKKIGKSLIYATSDEFIEFFSTILREDPDVSSVTLLAYISFYRNFFKWLIKERGFAIKNPLTGERFQLMSFPKTFDGIVEKMSLQKFDELYYYEIERSTRINDRNRYLCLIMNLYYYGAKDSMSIANIKDEDVNPDDRSIICGGKKIKLPKYVFMELEKIHSMRYYVGDSGVVVPLENDEGYYIGLPTNKAGTWDRAKKAKQMNNYLTVFLNNFDKRLSITLIKRFGFVNYMREKYGEHAREIVYSYCDAHASLYDLEELRKACDYWGYSDKRNSAIGYQIIDVCMKIDF